MCAFLDVHVPTETVLGLIQHRRSGECLQKQGLETVEKSRGSRRNETLQVLRADVTEFAGIISARVRLGRDSLTKSQISNWWLCVENTQVRIGTLEALSYECAVVQDN